MQRNATKFILAPVFLCETGGQSALSCSRGYCRSLDRVEKQRSECTFQITGSGWTDQEDLLAAYIQAASAWRVACEAEELARSNLPPYDLLVSTAGGLPGITTARAPR